MNRKYERAYRLEWEQDPVLSSWISKSKEDPDVAFCKACNTKLVSRLSALKEHAITKKHVKNMIGYSGQSSVQRFFKDSPIEVEVKKAELNMCALLVEHNLPFRLMDHMSEIISKCFSNPEVAKLFSCKRTKAAALTYNVLKPELEREMHEDLKSYQNISSQAPVFSLIMDKSTDVSSTKMLAVVTKYYSKKCLKVKTKFLTLVDLEGETAQHLFDALSKALQDVNLDIKNAIGFGADTTNVMFGDRGGVIAKIKEENPHCVFIKCVCHSTALSVSHASKDKLPRAVNQVVQEVYGYFAHSSKRQRELSDFQEFGDYTTVHMVFKDVSEMFMSLLSCYMKSNYIKCTDPLDLDPKSTVNFLPLKQMYLGVNVGREIDRLGKDFNDQIRTFLDRMQSFLIELCSQLKTRLPLNSLFRDLKFLAPQHVVYEDISSIANIINNFPNLGNDNHIQKIDEEYRQLKLDKDVEDLLESGGSSSNSILSVDKFWGAIYIFQILRRGCCVCRCPTLRVRESFLKLI
ncbi:unnamed protein product [Brassicogethes aeneus]|uniref:DUF4371 domain-containing protein n=1 Tax=Brassicogethes aeneus TaxID=1431903 RepID=A0A9P0FPV8_BRAAE|nr:unnamed protein product [Brassicogethes aeneus]